MYVGANPPVISNNDTQVTYNVTLTMPGDYYEFTVDAVNEGTIDAMIQTFSNTGLTTEQEKYLSYSIKYANGFDVANKHLLAHGETTTYVVRVEYKKDLNAGDLPTSDQIITLTFSVTYEQADSTAIEVVTSYVVSNTLMTIGESIPNGVNLRSTPALAMADWDDIIGTPGETRPFYLKHILLNNNINVSYVGFVVTSEMATSNPGMTAGTYYLRGGVDEEDAAIKPVYEKNKETLLKAFGSTYCEVTGHIYCLVPGLHVYAYDMGYVKAHDNIDCECFVDGDATKCS